MVKLTDVTGIGPATIKVLAEYKIKTVEALAAINLAELQKIPGFSGAIRARAVKKSAADCLQAKSAKPLTTVIESAQVKDKKTPVKKTVTSQIVSQPEPVSVSSESKKKKRNIDKHKDKQKLKKKKDKDKKKDGKKKGKNKKKS
ncbi:helix-hairpin-helix domain-containing protein [Nitrosomonas supralitoralis]|uniref:Helix-hairpin-helix domain-containing protein n=1 Tax=Nitrosomonas supralitoralis TaxID=2116706 RepID=A0A2P7NZQ1_9PROT|nr:helix-hairpin-helix domain-containing protein [Nitrosomonas supralitoralis]PSJ18925.1 helix-hairpin-helix domain-containing protein [Nitrosomonas supralitoralis]